MPFLEKTKGLSPEQQRAIGRRMVKTAVVAAVVVFLTGALLLRLLHITPGAVAVAGGIILALLAVRMALGPGDEVVREVKAAHAGAPRPTRDLSPGRPLPLQPGRHHHSHHRLRERGSVSATALVLGLVALVGGLDYLVFTNIDKLSKRMNPTTLVVSEIVFGVLLTAVAVQLFVFGLRLLGIIAPLAAAH